MIDLLLTKLLEEHSLRAFLTDLLNISNPESIYITTSEIFETESLNDAHQCVCLCVTQEVKGDPVIMLSLYRLEISNSEILSRLSKVCQKFNLVCYVTDDESPLPSCWLKFGEDEKPVNVLEVSNEVEGRYIFQRITANP